MPRAKLSLKPAGKERTDQDRIAADCGSHFIYVCCRTATHGWVTKKSRQIYKRFEMGDLLSDSTPLITAASSGKLRLVRLLVEGGAAVNGCNPRGETALLAACKALKGKPAGPDIVKLLKYLLQNKANPNIQDRAGRTALMYGCMEQAGLQVASILLAAGADPTMEDYSGASALVYAINAQHHPTVQVLLDACRARGHDIIIIATEMNANGGLVTRSCLNVPPSPDTSPVSCMSPSDIVLKTGSPNSPERENIFNFRGASKHGGSSKSRHPSCELIPLNQWSTSAHRKRVSSEPWLAIHNLARLNRAYEEGLRERSLEEEDAQDLSQEAKGKDDEGEESKEGMAHRREDIHGENHKDFSPRVSQSVLSLTERSSCHAKQSCTVHKRVLTTVGSAMEKELPVCSLPYMQLRRNTLPSVTVVPPLPHLSTLVNQSKSLLQASTKLSPSKCRVAAFLPHPPSSGPPSSSSKASARPTLLPSLASTTTSLVAPATCYSERSQRSLHRHSAQIEEIRGAHKHHADF